MWYFCFLLLYIPMSLPYSLVWQWIVPDIHHIFCITIFPASIASELLTKTFASNVELPKGNTTSRTARQFSTFFFPQLLPLTKSSTSGSPLRDDHRLPRIVLVLVFTPAVETIQLSLVQAMIKIPTYHIYEVQAYSL